MPSELIGAPRPAFTLAYASRRPACVLPTIDRWNKAATWSWLAEWIVCLDADDLEALKMIPAIPKTARVAVQSDLPSDCVKAWNFAASLATGKVIIAVSDDFYPPENWDGLLAAALSGGLALQQKVVRVSDGFHNRLCTLPILTSARYEQFGYIYHPSYRSMFADDEFTEVAYRDSVVIDAPELVFQHRHWDNGFRKKDLLDEVHGGKKRMAEGKANYEKRRLAGFPTLP